MDFDKANRSLTLLANLGVLAGIVFLTLEINQSNRIAMQEARSELTSSQHDVEMMFLENPDAAAIMVKLSFGDPLTPEEEFRASSYALLIVNAAAALNLTYENGFTNDRVLQRYMGVHVRMIERVPGIAPYLQRVMASSGLTRRGISPVFDNLLDALERYAPESSP